jgi:hypothetical protein
MTELVTLEEHQTFASASQRARALATLHKQQTAIRRNMTGWEVLVPPHLTNVARGAAADGDSDDYQLLDTGDDDEAEREQLIEELEGDREDWARSEEEGWYYGDDD